MRGGRLVDPIRVSANQKGAFVDQVDITSVVMPTYSENSGFGDLFDCNWINEGYRRVGGRYVGIPVGCLGCWPTLQELPLWFAFYFFYSRAWMIGRKREMNLVLSL